MKPLGERIQVLRELADMELKDLEQALAARGVKASVKRLRAWETIGTEREGIYTGKQPTVEELRVFSLLTAANSTYVLYGQGEPRHTDLQKWTDAETFEMLFDSEAMGFFQDINALPEEHQQLMNLYWRTFLAPAIKSLAQNGDDGELAKALAQLSSQFRNDL